MTNVFQSNQGVKQGCILSPLLFNIFLADIVQRFEIQKCEAIEIGESKKISCLLWADDMVLLSKSDDGLKNMLSELSRYVEENHMEINKDKTKCMVLNQSGKFIRRSYNLGGGTIFTTNSYKYLGFIITPSGEITTGLKDLKDRASRAYQALKTKMGNFFMYCPTTIITLFNALVQPILLYNSDFWGCLKMPKNNPIANMQMRFCKELLGVQKQTTNVGVLLELGLVPIMLHGKKNCIKNWERIYIDNKANNLILQVCTTANEQNLTWPSATRGTLNRIGIGLTNTGSLSTTAFMRMKDIFHQESFSTIKNEGSKLRTYSKIKTSISMEKYLSLIHNTKERAAITKIRLSNHDLMIEKGRHLKINKELRFCSFCKNEVETELHFILKCKTFAPFRNPLLDVVNQKIPHFNYLQENEKLVILLNNENVIAYVGTFLNQALQCRRFLLKHHKNAE